MLTIRPGEHGSTFGGNPLACSVAMAALNVTLQEELPQRAHALEATMRESLESIAADCPDVIKHVRGQGLLWAVEMFPDLPGRGGGSSGSGAVVVGQQQQQQQKDSSLAWEATLRLRDAGLLTKPTRKHTLRIAPPLVITREQLLEALDILRGVMRSLQP